MPLVNIILLATVTEAEATLKVAPLAKVKVPEPVVAASIVNMLAPTDKVPLVKANVPLKVRLLFKLTPFALFMVKLFNAVTLVGMATIVALPPNDNEDDEERPSER